MSKKSSKKSKLVCEICKEAKPNLKRPKTGEKVCKFCFFDAFELEVYQTIVSGGLFKSGEKIAIGVSGGKDSTVLAHVMKTLNDRYNIGLELFLLSIDEGIVGYRDDSLKTVERNKIEYGLPLKVVSYKELYNWTMDEIVAEIGLKNNCTFCGVFRRQALDRGALLLGADKIVTGHNADDIAETVLMNILRGDIARLKRCTSVITGKENVLPRSKPLANSYEKEIVLYAYYKNLDYFSTECIYSPNAFRGHVRQLIKDLEAIRPTSILDIIHAGSTFQYNISLPGPIKGNCSKCGYISSMKVCKACKLLEGLNSGLPSIGIGRISKSQIKEQMDENRRKYEIRKAAKEGAKASRVTKAQKQGTEASNTATTTTKIKLDW